MRTFKGYIAFNLRYVFFVLVYIFLINNTLAQLGVFKQGDYRSKQSGRWNRNVTWEVFDGVAFISASNKPTSENDVYIQAGHSIYLSGSESVNNIYLHTGVDVIRLDVRSEILDVYGSVNLYYNNNETYLPDGKYIYGNGITPGFITTERNGQPGWIRLRGNSRTVFEKNYYSSHRGLANVNYEVSLDPGQTAYFNINVRLGNLVVASGIVEIGESYTIRPDADGIDGNRNGSITILSGAKLRGGKGIYKLRNPACAFESFIIEEGGILELNTLQPFTLAAENLDIQGNIELTGEGDQTLPSPNADGNIREGASLVSSIGNLLVKGSGNKNLVNDVIITKKLEMLGANTSLLANNNTLSYLTGAVLEYTSNASQTIGDEIPDQDGPSNTVINNTSNIYLASDKRIDGDLTLTNGSLILGANHFTLGPQSNICGDFSANNMVVTSKILGGELRKEFNNTGSFLFPIGENNNETAIYSPLTCTFTTGSFESNSYVGVLVDNTKYEPYDVSPNHYLNRIWQLTSNGISNASYNLTAQYSNEDIQGNKSDISAYFYENTIPILGQSLNISNDSLTMNGISSFGVFTGSNACDIINNTIDSNATSITNGSLYCDVSSPEITIVGNEATASGPISYQWQESFNGSNWTDMIGDTRKNLTVASKERFGIYTYRRTVHNTECGLDILHILMHLRFTSVVCHPLQLIILYIMIIYWVALIFLLVGEFLLTHTNGQQEKLLKILITYFLEYTQ